MARKLILALAAVALGASSGRADGASLPQRPSFAALQELFAGGSAPQPAELLGRVKGDCFKVTAPGSPAKNVLVGVQDGSSGAFEGGVRFVVAGWSDDPGIVDQAVSTGLSLESGSLTADGSLVETSDLLGVSVSVRKAGSALIAAISRTSGPSAGQARMMCGFVKQGSP